MTLLQLSRYRRKVNEETGAIREPVVLNLQAKLKLFSRKCFFFKGGGETGYQFRDFAAAQKCRKIHN